MCILGLCLVTIGCSKDDKKSADERVPIPGNPSGWAEESAPGFMLDGTYAIHATVFPPQPVNVAVTLENGYITDVVIDGPSESPGIGSVVIDHAPERIIANNSFDIDLQSGLSISSASRTADAIKIAGKAAIQAIIDGE